MYNLYEINDIEELRSILRQYQSKIESYGQYCDKRQKKYIDNLINYVNLLEQTINQLLEIDKIIPEIKSIFVSNSEKSHSVSDVKAKINITVNNLLNERQKLMNDCVKIYNQTRAIMKSLWSVKDYRANCEEIHLAIAQISSLEGILMQKSEKDNIQILDNYSEENERHENQLLSEGISDVDKKVEMFEQSKTHLNNTLLTIPADSMRSLVSEIKKEERNISTIINPEKIQQIMTLADRLKGSSLAISDLKFIKRSLEDIGIITNKQIVELISYVNKVIEVEEKRRSGSLKQFSDSLQKIELATSALEHYEDILTSNLNLEKDKQQIENNTHPIQEKIEIDERKNLETAKEISRLVNDQKVAGSISSQVQAEELRQVSREEKQEIEEEKKYIKNRSEEISITSLPPEYIDMKSKLKDSSTLRKIIDQMMMSNNGSFKR